MDCRADVCWCPRCPLITLTPAKMFRQRQLILRGLGPPGIARGLWPSLLEDSTFLPLSWLHSSIDLPSQLDASHNLGRESTEAFVVGRYALCLNKLGLFPLMAKLRCDIISGCQTCIEATTLPGVAMDSMLLF